jgi:hypothetical protein
MKKTYLLLSFIHIYWSNDKINKIKKMDIYSVFYVSIWNWVE